MSGEVDGVGYDWSLVWGTGGKEGERRLPCCRFLSETFFMVSLWFLHTEGTTICRFWSSLVDRSGSRMFVRICCPCHASCTGGSGEGGGQRGACVAVS